MTSRVIALKSGGARRTTACWENASRVLRGRLPVNLSKPSIEHMCFCVRTHTSAVAGFPGTCGEPTQTLWGHVNSTQKGPDKDCIHGLPAVRTEPLQFSQRHSISVINKDVIKKKLGRKELNRTLINSRYNANIYVAYFQQYTIQV